MGVYLPSMGSTAPAFNRIADITFEGNSLTGTNGADSSTGTGIAITSTSQLKGSYSANVNASAASAFVQKDFTAVSTVFLSVYFWLLATTTATVQFLQVRDSTSGYASLRFGSDNTIRLLNSAGTYVNGTGVSITLNTLYRAGLLYTLGTGSNGIARFWVAMGDAEFSATPNYSFTNDTGTAAITRVRCGCLTTATLSVIFDDLRIDSGAMPGPSS